MDGKTEEQREGKEETLQKAARFIAGTRRKEGDKEEQREGGWKGDERVASGQGKHGW